MKSVVDTVESVFRAHFKGLYSNISKKNLWSVVICLSMKNVQTRREEET